MLSKDIGSEPCAESWEVCDREAEQSVVLNGPLAGQTLASLVADRGAELLGRHHPQQAFPLLFKFLDAEQTLSVQVHPDDRRAAHLNPPERGKTEAWLVLASKPGSRIYAGLKRGFDRATIQRELARGTLDLCLHSFEPQVGDCIFVPAGLIHALGAGLLVAELQQASDTTYRLFDWNRLGTDGQPRPLHVDAALEAADYELGPIGPVIPERTDQTHVERLVTCEHFVWDRWQFDHPVELSTDDRCHLLAVIEGAVEVEVNGEVEQLLPGHTLLIPAACGLVRLKPAGRAVLLDAYLP